METIIALSFRPWAREEDQKCAYEIKTMRIQDYRLIQAKLHENIAAEHPKDRKIRSRMRARSERKRQEQRIRGFQGELAALLDEREDNFLFCAGRLPENMDVRRLIPLPVFEEYLEQRWVERLLAYGIYNHFVVLGTTPYLPRLLCMLAPRMKSVLWILPDHLHAKMLEDFVEDFYQEYGLAINLRYLSIDGSYGQLRVEGCFLKEPLNVLDFTEDRHVPAMKLPAGSIWLDMAAVEEKERRLSARMPEVTYFSLKKQWKHPTKATYLLDTVPKNRYNT